MVAADQLAAVFVEVADTLTDDFDLIEFMHIVTARCSELFEVTAAGILLAGPDGRPQLIAASDERTQMLELFQLQVQEGPCHDCFQSGTPTSEADLRQASGRWPRFAGRAVAAGHLAVHAFPMRLRAEVIGALNLFMAEPGALAASDARVIQALTDVATIAVLQERSIRKGELLAEQLQAALNSRIAIEQAKGALAQIHGVTVDEAFVLLREYARRHHLRLTQVAGDIATHPERVRELTDRSQH